MRGCLGIAVLAMMCAAAAAGAQVPITFNYVYDETGQLIKVIDSTGVVIEYVYDAVGNMLEIKRTVGAPPAALSIFDFNPKRGGPLTRVTIQGQGFNPLPASNIVRFNGVQAVVLAASATSLVAEVPVSAATGPVTVQVSAATATSPAVFTVLPVPVISSVSPRFGIAGESVTPFRIAGYNLTGSAFAFVPPLSPPAVTILSAAIAPDGRSATLSLNLAANAAGTFVVVATNGAGSSDPFPSAANSLSVFRSAFSDDDGDGLPLGLEIELGTDPLNADTDGDGFPDGVEVRAGSDPLDPNSTPNKGPKSGDTASVVFAVVNASGALGTPRESQSVVFAVVNDTGALGTPRESASVVFSVVNDTGALGQPTEASSLLFSVANFFGPTGPPSEAESNMFSVLNAAMALSSRSAEESRRDPKVETAAAACTDTDADGLCDEDEFRLGTLPAVYDSDGDGYADGLEAVLGSNPLDADSVPRIELPREASGAIFSVRNMAVSGQIAAAGKPVFKGDNHETQRIQSKSDRPAGTRRRGLSGGLLVRRVAR